MSGADLASGMALEPDRRLVGNMIRHGQNTLLFVVNNRGYVIESEIHEGSFNCFKNWDCAGLVSA